LLDKNDNFRPSILTNSVIPKYHMLRNPYQPMSYLQIFPSQVTDNEWLIDYWIATPQKPGFGTKAAKYRA